MIAWLSERCAQGIEVDTDGVYFVPPGSVGGVADPGGARPSRAQDQPGSATTVTTIERLRSGISEILPAGIEVEFDEQFDAMFSYKAKNYALLTRSGDVIIKGGALKSRGLEKFQRAFLEEMIKRIMEGKKEEIGQLRHQFEKRIRNREMPIEMLMKTDTLQDSLEKYRGKIAG